MLLARYIEERSVPEPMSGCWIWLRCLGSHGYGQAYWPGIGNTVAHRLSYLAFVGAIPSGMLVQHTCDMRWCVAPAHLQLGTDATNAHDKQRKGRAAKKLDIDEVTALRHMASLGYALRALARRFGVSQRLVQHIVRRRIWTHCT